MRSRLKQNKEEAEEKEASVVRLGQEVERMKGEREQMERAMESEKATALQEISRGKVSALQKLQAEAEERLKQMREEHALEVDRIRAEMEEKARERLEAEARDKERELSLKEEEVKVYLLVVAVFFV